MYIDETSVRARQTEINNLQTELQLELSRLSNLLDYAKQFETVRPAVPLPGPIQAALPMMALPIMEPSERYSRRRTMTPGLRKAVTLALYTGPLTYKGIFDATPLKTLKQVREVVGAMRIDRLCFVNETGHFQLSEEGKRQADWFLKNPEFVMYRPNSRTAINKTYASPQG